MEVTKLTAMHQGWLVGDFLPTAFKTPTAEVCYRLHRRGESWPRHVHKVATEITLLVRGHLQLNTTYFSSGDIITVFPGEAVTPKFLTDCEMVVVKIPSVPGDKYEV